MTLFKVAFCIVLACLVQICQPFLFGSLNCRYGNWSKCSLDNNGHITRTRNPLKGSNSRCLVDLGKCDVGTYLAEEFVGNFLEPSVASPRRRPGSTQSRLYGRRRRSYSRRRVSSTGAGSAQNSQTCTEKRDSRGNVIMGNCNTRQQQQQRRRPTRPRRSFRPNAHRDLLIMMDESGSVGTKRFEKVKRIGAAIVHLLCKETGLHRDKTRVAVMSFDSTTHSHVRLNKFYNSKSALANFINDISYSSSTDGRTCMSKALDYAKNTALSNSQGGRRGQSNVQQDIVLITDGCANCLSGVANTLLAKTKALISEGIHVYVIGIGLHNNCRENLKILAQGGKCAHFFYINQWDKSVDYFIEKLRNPDPNKCIFTAWGNSGRC